MERAEEIIARLLSHYSRRHRPRRGDPFRSLVRIILSQNTSSKNQAAAYDRLERDIGVTPKNLAKASVKRITDAIRPAGMHNQRSRTLKKVAEAILERYGGDMAPILCRPYNEAREEIMAVPGVGQKTADVLLMFEAGKAIIPVDRHIFRITERLQLVPQKAAYDDVRSTLEEATDPDRYEDVHILLIRFGREFCRARRPRCGDCFLNDLCTYPKRRKN